MRIFRYPIEQYNVNGGAMMRDGEYSDFGVDMSLRRASAEQVRALEEFLIAQGWMK